MARVSWSDPLTYSFTLIILAGLWDGDSARRGRASPPWVGREGGTMGFERRGRGGAWEPHSEGALGGCAPGRRFEGGMKYSVECALCSTGHIPPFTCVRICYFPASTPCPKSRPYPCSYLPLQYPAWPHLPAHTPEELPTTEKRWGKGCKEGRTKAIPFVEGASPQCIPTWAA